MKSFFHHHPVLKKIVLLILILAGLFLARLAIGIGSVWIHYSKTPDFSTYITETPVKQETLEKLFPEESPLAKNDDFFTGATDPAEAGSLENEYMTTSRFVEVTLDHGSDQLLRFSQGFHQTLDSKTRVRHGFRVDQPKITSHPDLRVMNEAQVFDLDDMFDPNNPGRGCVRIQLAIAAGAVTIPLVSPQEQTTPWPDSIDRLTSRTSSSRENDQRILLLLGGGPGEPAE